MTPLAEVLILILGIVALVLALGLPLLLPKDSPVHEIVTLAIVSIIVFGFIWMAEAYWIIVPILGAIAAVVWLDRGSGREAGGAGLKNDPGLRARLWRACIVAKMVLVAGIFVAAAAGLGMAAFELILGWWVVFLAAGALFQLSHNRHRRASSPAVSAAD